MSMSHITIHGNVGRDPELRTAPSGKTYCTFSVAVSAGYGEQKQTDWYAVSVFGKSAEAASKILAKGSQVLVTGNLKQRRYEGRDGTQKFECSVTADNWTATGGRREDSERTPEVPSFDDDLPY